MKPPIILALEYTIIDYRMSTVLNGVTYSAILDGDHASKISGEQIMHELKNAVIAEIVKNIQVEVDVPHYR